MFQDKRLGIYGYRLYKSYICTSIYTYKRKIYLLRIPSDITIFIFFLNCSIILRILGTVSNRPYIQFKKDIEEYNPLYVWPNENSIRSPGKKKSSFIWVYVFIGIVIYICRYTHDAESDVICVCIVYMFMSFFSEWTMKWNFHVTFIAYNIC